MIDLNPLVTERHTIKPPANATAEEYHCIWYSITDKVSYIPGVKGSVTYSGCFHDLPDGLQTHVYAPMGLNIRSKWSLGGSLPGEPVQPVELGLGVPMTGLYIREDVDMKCNVMLTSFVKKTLKKAHSHLVERLLVKAQIVDGANHNARLVNEKALRTASFINSQASMSYAESNNDTESTYDDNMSSAGSNGPSSPLYYPYSANGMHSPPLTPGFPIQHQVRSPVVQDFREKGYNDPSLVPLGLSMNPPESSSFHGSLHDNQRGRASSYSAQGGQNSPRMVSWQNLTHTRQSPQMHSVDPAYQQANPYSQYNRQSLQPQPQPQPQSQFTAAELPSGKTETWTSTPSQRIRHVHEMEG